MKDLTLEFPSGFVKSDTPDPGSLLLQSSSFTLQTLPVQIGGLAESMALAAKRRMHYSQDNTEAEIELENTIPFGAEPHIKRKFRISDGLASMTMDLVMRASCTLTSVSAGGMIFGGVFRTMELIALDPEKKTLKEKAAFSLENTPDGTILYEGTTPPLALSFTTQTQKVDFMTGDDLWRWIQAPKMDGTSSFTIVKEKDSVRFLWQLFTRNPPRHNDEEQLPVPGKNWRITWAVAWKDLSQCNTQISPQKENSFALDEVKSDKRLLCADKKRLCLSAAGSVNLLKKFVRSHLEEIKEGDKLYLTGFDGALCINAGHMDRAKQKELLHWDMMSLLEFYRWSNKILNQKGASLTVLTAQGSPLKDFMILR